MSNKNTTYTDAFMDRYNGLELTVENARREAELEYGYWGEYVVEDMSDDLLEKELTLYDSFAAWVSNHRSHADWGRQWKEATKNTAEEARKCLAEYGKQLPVA